MKTKLLIFSTVLLLAVSMKVSSQNINVKIDPQTQYQQVEGWGASLCWWAHMVGRWDDDKIDEIVDWITSPDGLNMNIFRYNIGGGDDPSHYTTGDEEGHMVSGKGVRAEMEGFKPSETAAYDWTADAGQRKIMLKIKEKRPDAIFEAFSNSPPYWMTYSGCSAGNNPAGIDNLKPEYYDAFCDYLIDVCKHYKDEYGIEFKTLEPFNEPLTSYWGYLGGQEGCHFGASSQISLIKKLYPKLQASGLNTVISASDETSLSDFITALNAYISDGNTLPLIGQINTHSYSGSNAERASILRLSERVDKTLWQSETGPSGFSSSGIANNIDLAQRLFDDMRLMRPSAWLDWQLMEEWNDTWCQIRCNFAEQTYYRVKNFYIRMQVTRFVKQGYTIIKTNNENVLAAVNPQRDELVLCFINNTDGNRTFACDLSAFNAIGEKAVVYLTNSIRNCQKQLDKKIDSEVIDVSTTRQSVTTLIIPVLFADKQMFDILSEITFEDNNANGFRSNTAFFSVEDNMKNEALNNSGKNLAVQIMDGDSIIYNLNNTLLTSEKFRYLHVMTYTGMDANSVANGNLPDDVVVLNAGSEWKDVVIDLKSGTFIDSLIFMSSHNQVSLCLDNIVINNNPDPREITEESSVIDFESDNYRAEMLTNNNVIYKIEPNDDKTGLNVLGNALSFLVPTSGSLATTDTVAIKLSSPLKITDNTRYLHVMIKHAEGTKANISVGDISADKIFGTNSWRDLVVDMEAYIGNIVYEVKISPYATSKLNTKVWVDNIYFDSNSTAKTYTFEAPEINVPYAIVSRNSENALAQSDNLLIQSTYSSDYNNSDQQWIFAKAGDYYTISNKNTGNLISDNDEYYAEIKEASGDLLGQTFLVEHTDNGYAKITSTRTNKALDVDNASTSSGAKIGFWAFKWSGNYNQQWALIKLTDGGGTSIDNEMVDTNAPTLYSGKGVLCLTNLPDKGSYIVYSVNGMLMKQGVCKSDSETVYLPSGVYIVKVIDSGKQYNMKGVVR
ncbi:hypothetical protein D0T53_01670 [Dysgonomonas sp. 216]|uniref:glycoside hydrolase n=1 Tax=Dysgonomonas sp. 216 TaxID=2302934 RepID=UPI0013D693C0|nr:glycoside hydrolase [Dysgonomonas sp. 216]NDW17623.1 hypothetical protein [Dysgonomonas sp. 216]